MQKKRFTALIMALVSAILFGGCATQQSNQLTPLVAKNITIKRPALQTETTVEIGQSIMFWAYGPVNTVIKLNRPFEFTYNERPLSLARASFPAVAMRGDEYIARVPYVLSEGQLTPVTSGELLLSSGPQGCTLFVSNTFTLAENGVNTPVDNISNIFKGKRAIFGGSQPTQEQYQIPPETCALDQSTIANSEDSFRKELVYLGRSGDTIQLAYREFYNNMARPAFSNNIQYDLADSDVIGFQGARFKVISATNTLFTYKVIKHLQ